MAGQAFTTKYSQKINILKNNVKISPYNSDLKKVPGQSWVAVWDTGATNTVISENVAKVLGLIPISMGHCFTPQGEYDAYKYYIDLFLPNQVVVKKLLVMEGKLRDFDILIGMDIIGQGDFAVSNYNGSTSFSFRFPSMACLDFVTKSYLLPHIEKVHENGPGKNSPCPCGSGKKYKQCCGKQYYK